MAAPRAQYRVGERYARFAEKRIVIAAKLAVYERRAVHGTEHHKYHAAIERPPVWQALQRAAESIENRLDPAPLGNADPTKRGG